MTKDFQTQPVAENVSDFCVLPGKVKGRLAKSAQIMGEKINKKQRSLNYFLLP